MSKKKSKQVKSKNGFSDKLKFTFVVLFYILFLGLTFLLLTLTFLFSLPSRTIFLLEGLFFVVYSIFAICFKIPLFNRHYMYKSYRFDGNFGFRHYFGFSILIFLGMIFFLISFGK